MILLSVCVSSSPVPEITWKRANGVPFPSKVKMKYSNAVLEIPSFQQDDTGGYECVAENKMGKNTATGRLAFYGTVFFFFLLNTRRWCSTQDAVTHKKCEFNKHLLRCIFYSLLFFSPAHANTRLAGTGDPASKGPRREKQTTHHTRIHTHTPFRVASDPCCSRLWTVRESSSTWREATQTQGGQSQQLVHTLCIACRLKWPRSIISSTHNLLFTPFFCLFSHL